MYRVIVPAALALATAACSLNTSSVSSGFTDTSTASISKRKTPSGVGAEPTISRPSSLAGQKHASLEDKAPKGTFEIAPKGALSDRDYTSTHLDPQFARDVINQYRADHKLKPLKLNAELTEAAKSHSRDLAKWDRISHYGSDGSNPWDRVRRTGYKARLAAENVGTGQIDFSEVMRGWKASAGHNKNLLLSDATEMGLALVQDPKTEFKSFWTLVLASPM
ncbi:MAG: CAP domain-containing protein [Hyphomicrobium sp.]|nr:CAP domain-containing protein [Hyphomicrobium sp.]